MAISNYPPSTLDGVPCSTDPARQIPLSPCHSLMSTTHYTPTYQGYTNQLQGRQPQTQVQPLSAYSSSLKLTKRSSTGTCKTSRPKHRWKKFRYNVFWRGKNEKGIRPKKKDKTIKREKRSGGSEKIHPSSFFPCTCTPLGGQSHLHSSMYHPWWGGNRPISINSVPTEKKSSHLIPSPPLPLQNSAQYSHSRYSPPSWQYQYPTICINTTAPR
jgi:hypothetical protein